MSDWQPIETAPEDEVLILWPNMVTAVWDMGAENWLVMNVPLEKEGLTIANEWSAGNPWFEVMADAFGGVKPTHWQLFPEPPK